MDWTVIGYCLYLAVSLVLTVGVAWTLSRNGFHFLKDVYAGNEPLARAVNHLLVVGFYLLNLGYILLGLKSDRAESAQVMIETVSAKLGLVMLILGGLHMLNLYFLSRARKSSVAEQHRRSLAAERGASPPSVPRAATTP